MKYEQYNDLQKVEHLHLILLLLLVVLHLLRIIFGFDDGYDYDCWYVLDED